ncbi:recombinase RecA [candidate division WWE3 bacterium CG_4_9_14_0_2_um_filter_35_11]|uniref:Protein RecA n=1 Tax=candidate division WWE3 bacterium CG_4_9_14_0_2_um_filter_35_11 TaxID=1975077 RepID=A0A2M8ELB2_UNCKA|nr:MAG: recombinase RecA [candidate division WWE3 bacterium CG10_big_fil_rev_8_21_14_0_10_35_32]PJC23532.1 MAG: recombinase RecA [candidate division WWE3 bacterium CG_4_9_14_0_2_um_filter_35_11]
MATKEEEKIKLNKAEALKSAIEQIEKNYGKGSIMKMGDTMIDGDIAVIPTGAVTLDIALGVGGVPRGRIVEIYGPESSGKTTLTLSIISQAQKMGGKAAFIDAEHAFDPAYAQDIGVNVDEMYISQPDNGEQALEITETLIRSGALDVIVIDSVAALTPRAEIEGEMGDSHMGLQARLMSQALRKITAITNRSRTTVIFTNQIREKIGIVFGNPETTTGGRSLKFYASVRLEIRRVQSITDKGDATGNKTRVKVVKNKVAPPFKTAEFDIMFGKGISKEGSLLDGALEFGIIDAAGAWFKYKGENIGQGRENTKQYITDNPKFEKEIEGLIIKGLHDRKPVHKKEVPKDDNNENIEAEKEI